MKSQWLELKPEAIKLRTKGFSLREIEKKIGVPSSTLCGWLKNIELTSRQKEKLHQQRKDSLCKAREKAVLWHNTQKEKRIARAKELSIESLSNIDISNIHVLELALSILYLGEGSKKSDETCMASSDPQILKFFLFSLKKIYKINTKNIRCELNLRHDQDAQKMKMFWSTTLKVPLSRFKHVRFDKRTVGTKTYKDYRGVCYIRCGNVAIQRRLIFLSELYCNRVVKIKGS
jgi:transposase